MLSLPGGRRPGLEFGLDSRVAASRRLDSSGLPVGGGGGRAPGQRAAASPAPPAGAAGERGRVGSTSSSTSSTWRRCSSAGSSSWCNVYQWGRRTNARLSCRPAVHIGSVHRRGRIRGRRGANPRGHPAAPACHPGHQGGLGGQPGPQGGQVGGFSLCSPRQIQNGGS